MSEDEFISLDRSHRRNVTAATLHYYEKKLPDGYQPFWQHHIIDLYQIDNLICRHTATGRLYLVWFRGVLDTYPSKLVRIREFTFGEMVALYLLRKSLCDLYINRLVIDRGEIIELTPPKPRLP